MAEPSEVYEELSDEMGKVLVGNEVIVERLLTSLLTRGHVLLEGVPGVAKTTIANLFATSTGLNFSRIQMTPDILPADITGTHVYREPTGEFVLQRGPIFSNLVLADEINRATPKTQSALLEAMQEEQVTIEGETLLLPMPFMVIATQNPIEYEGVYELPEAQRDRFQLKLKIDLPDRESERELLHRFDDRPHLDPDAIEQVVSREDIVEAREAIDGIYVDDRILDYILDIISAVRRSSDVNYGPSPRAGLAFLNTSKASAAISGREYVIPDDIKKLAIPILAHRIVLSTDTELSDIQPEDVVEEIIDQVEPPGSNVDLRSKEMVVRNGGEPDETTVGEGNHSEKMER